MRRKNTERRSKCTYQDRILRQRESTGGKIKLISMWQNWFSNFPPDCFLPPRSRWGVYPNTLWAPPDLCLWNLDNRETKFIRLLLSFLSSSPLYVLVCKSLSFSLCQTYTTAHICWTCCLQKLDSAWQMESMGVMPQPDLWECAEVAEFKSLQT